MMIFLLSALLMGAAGSLHCIGMCGPLALSLPLGHNKAGNFVASFLYNAGRVVTYGTIGTILGLAGSSFRLLGFQQALSITVGVIIILFLVIPGSSMFTFVEKGVQKYFSRLRNYLGELFRSKKFSSVFFIGIINGFLPCGLVYMAAAVAITSASAINSGMYMVFFGLGTFPLMWALSFFGNFISIKTRVRIRKAYPYMLTIMACILIVRGLGLGIPYLSPAEGNTTTNIECHPGQ